MHFLLLFFLNCRVTKARKSLIIKLHRTLLSVFIEKPLNESGGIKTSTVVGVLLDHGLGEALLLKTLLLRSPTVFKLRLCLIYQILTLPKFVSSFAFPH